MVLDSFFDFRRDSIKISLQRRLGVEIKNWTKQVFELLRSQIGNVVIEYQIDVGAARIRILITRGDRRGASHGSANFDVLIPLLLLDRATVELKVDSVGFDHHTRNSCF